MKRLSIASKGQSRCCRRVTSNGDGKSKPGDRIRTGARSQVILHWSEKSATRLGERSDVEIQAAPGAKQPSSFSLLQGVLYFFNRGGLTNARYGTRTASAGIRGTDLVLQAEDNGRTTLT